MTNAGNWFASTRRQTAQGETANDAPRTMRPFTWRTGRINNVNYQYIDIDVNIYILTKLPQWPIKQYRPIWLIWSSGTPHAELYSLPLSTISLQSLVVTSHLVPAIWNIISRLTSVLAKLSQHSTDTWNPIFSIQPLLLPIVTHLSASDSFTTMEL